MSNSIMYQEDGYVVLETNKPEQLMSESELLTKLKQILTISSGNLSLDLPGITSVEGQAKYLLDNYCELDLGEGQYLQWYVTRWQKN
jgi:hypothetical protein